MLNQENQKDKDRFEKLKETQVERGRNEEKAIEIAAGEVKEMRRREFYEKPSETKRRARLRAERRGKRTRLLGA